MVQNLGMNGCIFQETITILLFISLCVCPFFLSFKLNFCQKFSGTTRARIYNHGINVGHDYLYCVRDNQPLAIHHFLCLTILPKFNTNIEYRNVLKFWDT